MCAILRSPRFTKLTRLRVGYELLSAMEALADGPAWPSLRELVIACPVPEDARDALTAALKKRAFPALSRIEVAKVLEDEASRGFAERLAETLVCTVDDD